MTKPAQRKVWLGVLVATGIYAIYGLNMVVCKDLTNSSVLSPWALFTVRVGGAALLFWLASLFMPGERMTGKDLFLCFVGSLLCITIPQYSTLWGITMSTPYDASLVATLKPVLTMTVAFLLGKEVFKWNLLLGVLLTFTGAVALVFTPGGVSGAYSTSPLGLLVLLANGVSFAFYLVLFRDFVSRHSALALMKWMFLFALLLSLPFSGRELLAADYTAFNSGMVLELLFLIVFATFITHFIMPVGQRNLTSTQYSLFSYVQCIVAAIAGILMGMEDMNLQKIVASVFFVVGVWVIRRAR